MCFTVQRNFTPTAESLSGLNSLAPKFSISATSPSFGVSIWPRRKQTANVRSIPAVSPRFLCAATDNGPTQAGTPTREDDPRQGPTAGRPAPVCLHQSQIPFVGMSHEFIDAELGIGVLFFLVIAQPDCGP